ncbi:alcohol dehydrogenase [Methylacidiphilum sp. Yel]|jgi:propanol-preferring alcohol dehydrogenase|uniref:zinc-dependent alcohol dehydrogenase family protein n=1 Tax=Methylacidiphilum sp. Yel TaxID=1847730 RepID=UPI00106DA9F6|nr:zinc-dependent alcohol dehydrogenase family protein [Methylacidiphilum sp. Yel]TFE66914.1 alcohol dehydrogenase [Methylacidiphilum sp. Yel]
MKAMVLEKPKAPLILKDIPIPDPGPGEILLEVLVCGICRTDLHVVDGELPNPKPNLVPGHEVVGIVRKLGAGAKRFSLGQRVGVPWLGKTCGQCKFCISGKENLCDHPEFTGYTLDGGYAEWMKADERFCYPIPTLYTDKEAAPLLCAGLIGFRSYRHLANSERIGFYGFGAAAHILIQIANYQGIAVYSFSRPGDKDSQQFALSLGAVWSGDSTSPPPVLLEGAIIFAPVGSLIPHALQAVEKGGKVVCAGIYMTDIPSFPYKILWGERQIVSVANLTRQDGEEFFKIASKFKIQTHVEVFPLSEANEALERLRKGKVQGALALIPNWKV